MLGTAKLRRKVRRGEDHQERATYAIDNPVLAQLLGQLRVADWT